MKRNAPALERRGRRTVVGEPPQINLLPDAVRTRHTVRRLLRAWSIGLGVGAAVVALGAFGVAATGAGGAQLQSQVRAQRAQIQLEEAATRQMAADAARLVRARDALVAGRARESAAVLLRTLAGAVPDDAALRTLDVVPSLTAGAEPQKAQPGQELKLTGLALEYAAVGEIQERLRRSGLYREVTLVRAEANRAPGAAFDFSIACRR